MQDKLDWINKIDVSSVQDCDGNLQKIFILLEVKTRNQNDIYSTNTVLDLFCDQQILQEKLHEFYYGACRVAENIPAAQKTKYIKCAFFWAVDNILKESEKLLSSKDEEPKITFETYLELNHVDFGFVGRENQENLYELYENTHAIFRKSKINSALKESCVQKLDSTSKTKYA